jgi:hypothetical protein
MRKLYVAFTASVLAAATVGCGSSGNETTSSPSSQKESVAISLGKARTKLAGACSRGEQQGSSPGASGKQIAQANQAIGKAIYLAQQLASKADTTLSNGQTVSQYLIKLEATAKKRKCDPAGARAIKTALPGLSSYPGGVPSTSTTSQGAP